MTQSQRIVAALTLAVAAIVLHANFCEWFLFSKAVYVEPERQIVGFNGTGWKYAAGFQGIAAEVDGGASALWGIAVPLLLIGGGTVVMLGGRWKATEPTPEFEALPESEPPPIPTPKSESARVEWRCPECRKLYLIPVGRQPDPCPKCKRR